MSTFNGEHPGNCWCSYCMSDRHSLGIPDLGRDPRVDPKRGDRVGHIDGGTMYVERRLPKMVAYSRRPDHLGFVWRRLSTFQKIAKEVLYVAR